MLEEIELQYINYRAPAAERSTGEHSGRRLKVTVLKVAVVLTMVLNVVLIVAFAFFRIKECSKGLETTTNLTTTANATLTNTVPTCRRNAAPCDDDWELHGTKCYYFSSRLAKLSWNDSRAMCHRFNGDLVKIDSREEQEFLDAKLQRLMFDHWDKFWIGLTDSESEGHWVWTDGSALNTSLVFWAEDEHSKEPDNWTGEDPEGEDCVRMGQKPSLGKLNGWYDRSCKKKHRHICEKNPSTTEKHPRP